jgi:hypothetical protein
LTDGASNLPQPVPVLDPTRYGEGVYRRRIRIATAEPGVVRAELEDDYHHFRCTLTHDGGVITGCEGEAVRHPWTTCPGAMGLLRSLAGTPLDARSTAILGRVRGNDHCTHLIDLAGLAIAHAHAGRATRQYDLTIPDRVGTRSEPVLERDGEVFLRWVVEGSTIVDPQPFDGVGVTGGFRDFVDRELDVDTAEAAVVLRRGTMISWGRMTPLDDAHLAADLGPGMLGSCHTFTVGTADRAERKRGSTWDFTDAPERLLDDGWL